MSAKIIYTPEPRDQFGSLDDVVRAYEEWLAIKSSGHSAGFEKRLKDDPEAARAEAAVFALLRAHNPGPDSRRGSRDRRCWTQAVALG